LLRRKPHCLQMRHVRLKSAAACSRGPPGALPPPLLPPGVSAPSADADAAPQVLQAMNFEEVEVGVIEVDVSGDEHALASFLASKGFVQHSTHSTRAHVFLHRNFSSTSEAA